MSDPPVKVAEALKDVSDDKLIFLLLEAIREAEALKDVSDDT